MKKVEVPWNSTVLKYLNAYQTDGEFHPYTCINLRDGKHPDYAVLWPTPQGFICAYCEYTQTWCNVPDIA